MNRDRECLTMAFIPALTTNQNLQQTIPTSPCVGSSADTPAGVLLLLSFLLLLLLSLLSLLLWRDIIGRHSSSLCSVVISLHDWRWERGRRTESQSEVVAEVIQGSIGSLRSSPGHVVSGGLNGEVVSSHPINPTSNHLPQSQRRPRRASPSSSPSRVTRGSCCRRTPASAPSPR